MFERLIAAKYPYTLLDQQYRMHPYLLQVPNKMYYGGKINNAYDLGMGHVFIDKEKPLLFVNMQSPEVRYGTSYYNKGEG